MGGTFFSKELVERLILSLKNADIIRSILFYVIILRKYL